MHVLKTTQQLPISLDEAWDFFSSPRNLSEITPARMGFYILSELPEKMYPGLIISYIVKPVAGIPVKWVTEISQVREKEFFVDFQLSGPYAIWHHQHHFRPLNGGVEMTDIVNYKVPFGFLGRIVNWLFVEREVKDIFEYRNWVLEDKFGKLD